jgi:hypothetical protein
MHHIEVKMKEARFSSWPLPGNTYNVFLVCDLVGSKFLSEFASIGDANMFAKAKANELGVDVLPEKTA